MSLGTFDLLAAALVYALNWKAKRRSVHHCTETEQHGAEQTCGCSAPGKAPENTSCLKCGEPSPRPQALPLGDGSAAQSCCSEAPRCLGGLAQSSSSGLREKKKTKTNMRCTFACIHKCTRFKIKPGVNGHLQAIRTVALRLLEVPRWLQATHRHQ